MAYNVKVDILNKWQSHSYTAGLTPTQTMIVENNLKSMYLGGTKKEWNDFW